MKRKYLFGLILVTAISVTIAFFVFQANSASAGDLTFEERLNQPPLQTPFPEGATPVPVDDGGKDHVSEEQIAVNKAILDDARMLIEKANTTYGGSGWRHTIFKIFMQSGLGYGDVVLPNGTKIPTDEWQDESWALLDKKGAILQVVTMSDFGPTVPIQFGTYKAEDSQEILNGSNLDSGFLQDAEMALEISYITSTEDFVGKEPVVMYKVATGLSTTPVEIGGRQVVGGYTNYYFSKETGLLLLLERYDVLKDGTAQLVQRIETILFEKIDTPPSEILVHLK